MLPIFTKLQLLRRFSIYRPEEDNWESPFSILDINSDDNTVLLPKPAGPTTFRSTVLKQYHAMNGSSSKTSRDEHNSNTFNSEIQLSYVSLSLNLNYAQKDNEIPSESRNISTWRPVLQKNNDKNIIPLLALQSSPVSLIEVFSELFRRQQIKSIEFIDFAFATRSRKLDEHPHSESPDL